MLLGSIAGVPEGNWFYVGQRLRYQSMVAPLDGGDAGRDMKQHSGTEPQSDLQPPRPEPGQTSPAVRHESDEGFRYTFEEAALGMAHVGLDGRWLHINRKLCEIVGYTRDELLAMTFQDITHPDDLPADLAHAHDLLDGKADRYSMEKRYLRKDGSLVWVNLTASLLRDPDGTPRYFISVVEDITARKQMEEALARSCAELESQVAQRTSALRSLSNRLMQLQDEERRRIARELHDSVGQYLTALAINLDLLATPEGQNRATLVAESRQLLDHCLSETRTLSHLLHPPLLDETGFASAAQWYVEGFARRSGVDIQLRLPPLQRLPANVELMLFRVLQETLNNIHRHAESNKAEVSLDFDGRQVILEVRDFGQGIHPDRLERFRSSGTGVGVGLAGIRERVSELGGTMEISSGRGGTAVRVSAARLCRRTSLGGRLIATSYFLLSLYGMR